MRKSKIFFLFYPFLTAAILAAPALLWAAEMTEEVEHPGYLNSVSDERYQVAKEVIILPPVPEDETPLLNQIFTTKISRDFSNEFRRRFGYTEFEQVEYTSNPMIEMGGANAPLVQVAAYNQKQKEFGQYISKELLEYHVNNYLKGNRNTRVVYTAKEAITNVEFNAGKSGYKLKYRYRFTANTVNLKLERANEAFHKEVDLAPKPNKNANPTLRLGYDVNKTVLLFSNIAPVTEVTSLGVRKKLTPALSTSLTGQNYNKALSLNSPKQQRILLGLSWSD